MFGPRLDVALAEGLTLPASGTIAVLGARADTDLSALPKDQLLIRQGFAPDHDQLKAMGFDVSPDPVAKATAAIVILPRAKMLARAMVADAAKAVGPGGLVVIDGQKTDGIDSLLKVIKRRATVSGSLSKAHGRMFWITGGDFDDWMAGDMVTPEGHHTAPGIFSADDVDPATTALSRALPGKLGTRVADLGAGWGALSLAVLDREGVTQLDLVEAEHAALEAARRNIDDPRASFHWADVRTFPGTAPYDVIVSNPPFHTGRTAEPGLGQAFIAAAARLLSPGGQFWLVANRHLPYEGTLSDLFGQHDEMPGSTAAFKIIAARKPLKPKGGR